MDNQTDSRDRETQMEESLPQKTYFPPVPPARRIIPFLIDALIGGGPLAVSSILVLMPFIWMMTGTPLPPLYRNDLFLYSLGPTAIIIFFWFLFYCLCRDGFRGRSIGKRMCGLMVINLADGSPCQIGKSALRNLPMVLIALFHWLIPVIGFLGLFVEPAAVIIHPLGQRFGDRWANTQVVLAKKDVAKP